MLHHEKNSSLFIDTLSHYQKLYYNELKILTDNFLEEPFSTVEIKDYDMIFTLGTILSYLINIYYWY